MENQPTLPNILTQQAGQTVKLNETVTNDFVLDKKV